MRSVGREATGGTFFLSQKHPVVKRTFIIPYIFPYGHICFVLPPLHKSALVKNSDMATKKKQRNAEKNFARNKKCDKI